MESESSINRVERWANKSVSKWRLPSLDALIFSAAGLVVALVGSWKPDIRLDVAGIPMGTVLLGSMLLLATAGSIRRETLISIAILQAPFLLLLLTLAWSPMPAVGLDKLAALVVSGNLAFVLLNTVAERHGANELARILIAYLAILLVCAILYKSQYGLFNRGVSFFLNGPIIFARFMSIAAVLGLFYFSGKQRVLVVGIFTLAIIWTESKGPILAILVTLVGAILYLTSPRKRKFVIAVLLVLLVLFAISMKLYGVSQADIGRLAILISLMTGDYSVLEATNGSAGARLETWEITLALIFDRPLGVGLGGWTFETDSIRPYPHNLFLELWSEAGLVIGSIASLPFIYFLFASKNVFWFIAFTLFLAQMVSGDLGDARVMFIFALLASFSRTKDVRSFDAERNFSSVWAGGAPAAEKPARSS